MKTCKKCNEPVDSNKCKPCAAKYMRNWRLLNEDRNLELTRKAVSKWKKNNPDKANAHNRKRRALISGAACDLTWMDEIAIWKEHGRVCFWCGGVATTLEHIVPLSPRPGNQQGNHTYNNVVPACQPCNNKKSNKDPLVFLFEMRDLGN